jgi:hypothetical protein
MTDATLSYYDLMNQPEFKQAVKDNDKKRMDELLYSVGVNVSLGYETIICNHRPLGTNKEWHGPMICYTERTDKEWLRGGCASLTAHINSCTDVFLRGELKAHSSQISPADQDVWDEDSKKEFK